MVSGAGIDAEVGGYPIAKANTCTGPAVVVSGSVTLATVLPAVSAALDVNR